MVDVVVSMLRKSKVYAERVGTDINVEKDDHQKKGGFGVCRTKPDNPLLDSLMSIFVAPGR